MAVSKHAVRTESSLDRFLFGLLDEEDVIVQSGRFGYYADLIQGWTCDRNVSDRLLDRVTADGCTAMWDAVAVAVSLEQEGQFRNKALNLISGVFDGGSQATFRQLKQ